MNILIIGGGSMGLSFARGIKKKNGNFKISVVEHNEIQRKKLQKENIEVFADVVEVEEKITSNFDAIIVAVKPKDVLGVIEEIVEMYNPTLIISIAAGVAIKSIEKVAHEFPVVRAMPNLAAHVSESATAISYGKNIDEKNIEMTNRILSSIGTVETVNEKQMNLVTALSGSGPAYFYLLSEYLAKAAVELGMDEKTAKLLSEQTFIGSAKTLEEQKINADELRAMVTSPGGTTESAIESFENNELYKVVLEAVKAAKNKAEELG